MPSWLRNALLIVGRLAIAALLLVIILSKVKISSVGNILQAIDPFLILAATILILTVGAINAMKWYVLLQALRVETGYGSVARLTYIAVAWNLALPGSESGNLIKAAILARRRPNSASAIWASMLVDQITLVTAQSIVA
jgi:uncharacterized membrane protein YbhN (UPF0104 family)